MELDNAYHAHKNENWCLSCQLNPVKRNLYHISLRSILLLSYYLCLVPSNVSVQVLKRKLCMHLSSLHACYLYHPSHHA
jgi:hypothetical protein